MNGPHLHLVLNHLPVVGTLIGTLALLVSLVARRQEWIRLSLGIVLVAGISTAPAFLSGEPAEDGVEGLPGAVEAAIEPHEEAAEMALVAGLLAAVVAAIALAVGWRRPTIPTPLAVAALATALAATALSGYTANLGGHIRHPEIGGAAPRANEPVGDRHEEREKG